MKPSDDKDNKIAVIPINQETGENDYENVVVFDLDEEGAEERILAHIEKLCAEEKDTASKDD